MIFAIVLIIYFYNNDEDSEHLDGSNEAVQTIATVYNSSNMTVGNISITTDATIAGKLTANGAISFLPRGSIIMWSGANVPEGWALCDGQKGTPDLRGRFVIGAGDSGTTNTYAGFGTAAYDKSYNFALNETGGEFAHVLLEKEMPTHRHGINGGGADGWAAKDRILFSMTDRPDHGLYLFPDQDTVRGADPKNTNKYPNPFFAAGGNEKHNNMPPYYALSYIMKTA